MRISLVKAIADENADLDPDTAPGTPCVRIEEFPRIQELPRWNEWVFEVDISVANWPARSEEPGAVRQIPPPGTRKNAQRPFDDPAVRDAVIAVAEGVCGRGRGGDAFIEIIAAASPTPHRRHGRERRAATIAAVYELALNRGFSPHKTITSLYSLDVDEDGNERPGYEKKLEQWIKVARTTMRPDGQPYLRKREELPPLRQWPNSRRPDDVPHPHEPVRLPWKPESKTGPYAGQVLTVRARRTDPDPHGPAGLVGADVELTGVWDDGTESDLGTMRQVDGAELITRMLALSKELEQRYPGARVRATTG